MVSVRRLSLDELRMAASNKAARKAYHAHLNPWPRPADSPSAAALAAGGSVHGSLANGNGATADAVEAPAGPAVGNAGGTAAGGCALTPWDAQEFTDEELREQLRHVIGDVF